MRVVKRYRRILLVGLIPHTADDILIKSAPKSVLILSSQSIIHTQCLSHRAFRRQTIPNLNSELLILANRALILPRKRFLTKQRNQTIGLSPISIFVPSDSVELVTDSTLWCFCKHGCKALRGDTIAEQRRQKDETLEQPHGEKSVLSINMEEDVEGRGREKKVRRKNWGAWNGMYLIRKRYDIVCETCWCLLRQWLHISRT